MTKTHKHIYACKWHVILKHVVLDHFVINSERCQSVLSEAMDYSDDKKYLTGLTQNVFSRETCPGEFDDFIDILGSEWLTLNKQS